MIMVADGASSGRSQGIIVLGNRIDMLLIRVR